MKFLFAAIIALACTFSAKAICPGDLNGDLRVGVEDLLIVIDHWGEGTPDGNPMPWDLTGDGRVNVSDILFLFEVWGLGDDTNPWSCYPQNAPYDAPPELSLIHISEPTRPY